MNNLLRLQGTLLHEARKQTFSKLKFSSGVHEVTIKKIDKLIDETQEVYKFWTRNTAFIDKCLVAIKYIDIIPKSRRVTTLFKYGKDNRIVGAKFKESDDKIVHSIVYLTDIKNIHKTLNDLCDCKEFVSRNFKGIVTNDELEYLQKKECKISRKSNFTKILFDISNIDSIYIETIDNSRIKGSNIVSFYNVEEDINKILDKLDIDIMNTFESKVLGDFNFLLTEEQIRKISSQAGYLISMSCTDLADLVTQDETEEIELNHFIDSPKNEPIIGVIDTLFDTKCYFNEWVDYHSMVDLNIPEYSALENSFHGTEVSSIIVDGTTLNPKLDDHCGRFRVRHFGVATKGFNSRTKIMNDINKIIRDPKNFDVHVWNISLGSEFEVSSDFISPEGALLDKLQNEFPNIIFVISGTNDNSPQKGIYKKIGAPADSLNSVVVNSINYMTKEPAQYTRKGEVLSFFVKPDISYYGGDLGDEIITNNGLTDVKVKGTSFAAPFIARKLAYLIDVLGMKREVAKALLIDSAASWNTDIKNDSMKLKGYGIVPIKIEDIVKSQPNEIKFFIQDNATSFNTQAYNLPIPIEGVDKTMYLAKGVLCYAPCCDRNQGVDYTKTELSLTFGRLKKDSEDGTITLNSIGNNTQDVEGCYNKEAIARKNFRKWDNIKRVCEKIPENVRARECHEGKWGFSLKLKERDNDHCDRGIPFGLVITLYEKNFKNKQDEFVRNCLANGWLVEEIDLDNKLEIYDILQEDIKLE